MLENVLIVDDHPTTREGLAGVLRKNMLVNNIIEAGSYDEAYFQVSKKKPDLILMDISLHGLSGIDLSRKILKNFPDIKIIIVSMYSRTQFIVESLEAGVHGYILKEATPETLVQGIKRVVGGDIYVDSHISGKVINSFLKKNKSDIQVDSESYETLSLREQEILRLLADGLNVNEISEHLCISEKTVINHRTNILTKLNCRNSIELIRYAIHIGLIEI